MQAVRRKKPPRLFLKPVTGRIGRQPLLSGRQETVILWATKRGIIWADCKSSVWANRFGPGKAMRNTAPSLCLTKSGLRLARPKSSNWACAATIRKDIGILMAAFNGLLVAKQPT